MEHYRETIRNYTDEQLCDQYFRHRDEYLPEVQMFLDAEIKSRKIDIEGVIASRRAEKDVEMIHLDNKDFKPFDHVFGRIDLQLATAILRENGIVYFIDNPQSTDTIPLEGEAEKTYTIHVHESVFERAHEMLDEHFEKQNGRYLLKAMSVREQLKVFNFHDLHLSEKEALEVVNVVFTPEEKAVIKQYGKRVLEESDRIEAEQSRVLFYFDSIEGLFAHLYGEDELLLSRTELLTILEILQVFVDDQAFPSFMEESILTILSFFMS